MAASAIIISFDSSDESVGSPPSRVILFGDIPTVFPSFLLSTFPRYSYFHHSLCTDSSEAPDSSDGPPLQDPYVTTIARWRSRVTAHPSSSHEFPIAPVTAPPGIRRRHASPRSPDHHSSSSSSSLDSSPGHSLGLDATDQAHSRSSTRDVSPRLCYPPRRAPRCGEAFRRWCAALYLLVHTDKSESSSGDSSERPMHLSSHSARPSRKRCRSPVDSVPLSMPITRSLAPTRADLLPPRKRFRDSYSSEASIEEDAEVGLAGTRVDMELGIGDRDEVGDHVGIDPMTAPLVEEEIVEPAGEDSPDSSGTRDGIVRLVEDMPVDLGDARRVEADQLIASGDRARMAEMIYSLRLENLKVRMMLDIKRDRVSSLLLHMSLLQEEFRQIHRDRDDARGRLRRLESYLGRRFGFHP
ncbi:hypothetical protein Tco_0228933 [Tanacetum coccineum]